jgi:hypothetical protein
VQEGFGAHAARTKHMYILLIAAMIVLPWLVSHVFDFKFWAELIVLIGIFGAFGGFSVTT